jgi:hypothetical protein
MTPDGFTIVGAIRLFPKVIKNSNWQVALMSCLIPPAFDNGLRLSINGFPQGNHQFDCM